MGDKINRPALRPRDEVKKNFQARNPVFAPMRIRPGQLTDASMTEGVWQGRSTGANEKGVSRSCESGCDMGLPYLTSGFTSIPAVESPRGVPPLLPELSDKLQAEPLSTRIRPGLMDMTYEPATLDA